ncbi:stage II sporulation protein R [Paenibacillus alba]|uniref:stage II sporulation protein R n=1 Tax=Paenibacillus alba TaxID=1197127 RepID=UPI001566262E|nr:stage II sporulation protein R [Paenibacillus alba]NQX70632.1 stage II sporulation protein R [Paenibacillus alba]
MVKRTERTSFKHLLLVAFALIVMITCWESNRTNAAVISPTIPKESIRLRILANSDSPQDQALKREIRDAIIARMQEWVVGPQSLDEARAVVKAHLAEFDVLVGQMIEARGYSYDHTVELGSVPFPTKMYGNQVYPAGDYEALRVTIGSGEGQNWWCVLFPPLCFVDSVSGEAVASAAVVAKTEGESKPSTAPAPTAKVTPAAKASNASKVQVEAQAQPAAAAAQPEVKFFVWEMIKKIASWFS